MWYKESNKIVFAHLSYRSYPIVRVAREPPKNRFVKFAPSLLRFLWNIPTTRRPRWMKACMTLPSALFEFYRPPVWRLLSRPLVRWSQFAAIPLSNFSSVSSDFPGCGVAPRKAGGNIVWSTQRTRSIGNLRFPRSPYRVASHTLENYNKSVMKQCKRSECWWWWWWWSWLWYGDKYDDDDDGGCGVGCENNGDIMMATIDDADYINVMMMMVVTVVVLFLVVVSVVTTRTAPLIWNSGELWLSSDYTL